MQTKNTLPMAIQPSPRTWVFSTDLRARLPLVVLLWSTCWLLTGCGIGKRSYQQFTLAQGPVIPSHSAIQAPRVNAHELTLESSEETFQQFFVERGATAIWEWLCALDYTQFVCTSILKNDPAIYEIVSLHPWQVQDELILGMITYINVRNQETLFRNLLFSQQLVEMWDTLNRARGKDRLDLAESLKNCNSAVKIEVLDGLVQFICRHLPDLVELDLSRNGLTTLPDTFGKLINLHTLYLDENQLRELPATFGDLRQLQMLHLNNNQLTTLPDSFGKLTQLTILNLNNNKLTALPDSFGNLTQLSVLWLEKNDLSALPVTFVNLINLEMLNLSNNQLRELPTTFGDLRQLQQLNLNNNKLTALPDTFGNLTQLQVLYLNSNQLIVLPDSFGTLFYLQSLDLSYNQLRELPTTFGGLINLNDLNLRSNQLTQLPDTFGKLINLNHLRLNNNQLIFLPDTFGKLINLKKLYLNNNKLIYLSLDFGDLINLRGLDLSNNFLADLPGSFKKLIDLDWIRLENNSLLDPNADPKDPYILLTHRNLRVVNPCLGENIPSTTFGIDPNSDDIQYYVVMFTTQLGELTLPKPVPIYFHLSGTEVATYVNRGYKVILMKVE